MLETLARRHSLLIDEIDITQDPVLLRRYDVFIPVIVVDGRIELAAPIEEEALKRAIGG